MQAATSTHQRVPPIAPEIVFFGLIFGQSFLPPTTEPVSIAKVSVIIGIKSAVKMAKTATFDVISLSFANGKASIWFTTTKSMKINDG